MLSPDKVTEHSNEEWEHSESRSTVDVEKLIAIAVRQWRPVALSAFLFLVLGIIYIVTAVPKYTASTSVLIDRGNSELLSQLSNAGVPVEDDASVLSEVELFKSDTISSAVIDKLKLLDNPEFSSPDNSPISMLRSLLKFRNWFASDDVDDDDADSKRRDAAQKIVDNMDVDRVGRTYALSVSYTSTSPDLAAKIAGSIADAYLVDKLNSKYEATRRASDWLQERIEELRQKALDSDLAVQKFRTAHGLLNSGGQFQLLSDQQLSELTTQLISAQAETAKAQAKYDRVKSIIDNKRTDAIVTDVLDNSISNDLRKKYLEASKIEAEISARLGPDHIQAVRLRSEMAEYQRLMFEELNRIAESYQSELQVAQTREKALQANVTQASSVSATAGETQVQLRELERTADTYRNLYQTFLTRFQEATQQQTFPITEARVITRPQVPTSASAPKKPLVLALALVLGSLVGGGIGAYREFRDRFFRTGDQVRDVLSLEYIGHVPIVDAKEAASGASELESTRGVQTGNGITNYVVNHPLSAFAETMRSAKIAVDMENPSSRSKVIGVISCLPGEGKSTIAINLAQLLAMQGARTLLIDADLRNPGATRAIGRHAEQGILEALLEGKPLKDLLLLDSKTRLAFLPAVVKRRVPHSSDLLSSSIMANMLEELKAHFDYIVLDLPPVGPVVDARAISPMLDASLAVIEWGRTSRRVVRTTFAVQPELMQKCIGVVLNKVDTEKLKLYRTYGSGEYYYNRYSAYYHEA
ncbi:polysaccharide biosynthesis tyrosine autokinase [Rhizobium mesosinicum]|uniref:non-specific protein-tyrosine kinase n=1 Tax=Rhizobium mesosinicum TaxID=335017 RepID=A0ABS7H135_9HYPH|nr:polysaccharide biosynthesis tyrosine autokinase [Rhizobium mesosinicum]MBW9055955.1 polysaccharide biosynthesis tyrosine autokinase [Rhizobium mesosinicum]